MQKRQLTTVTVGSVGSGTAGSAGKFVLRAQLDESRGHLPRSVLSELPGSLEGHLALCAVGGSVQSEDSGHLRERASAEGEGVRSGQVGVPGGVVAVRVGSIAGQDDGVHLVGERGVLGQTDVEVVHLASHRVGDHRLGLEGGLIGCIALNT